MREYTGWSVLLFFTCNKIWFSGDKIHSTFCLSQLNWYYLWHSNLLSGSIDLELPVTTPGVMYLVQDSGSVHVHTDWFCVLATFCLCLLGSISSGLVAIIYQLESPHCGLGNWEPATWTGHRKKRQTSAIGQFSHSWQKMKKTLLKEG